MEADGRRHPRTRTATPVYLRWTGPNRTPAACAGRIHDYSRSGLRIEMDLPVSPDVLLTVAVRDRLLRGVVRYCAAVRDRFVVGLEF